MKEFTINVNEAGQRIDKYLAKLLPNAEKGLLFKQLRNKNIVLNAAKAKGSEILNKGDVVKVFMADDTIEKFMGSDIAELADDGFKLKIIYKDKNIILADKPVGVLSQKSNPTDITMNEYLVDYMCHHGFNRSELKTFKPAFCNRLDRNTSGLMIGGVSLKGLQKMSEIIKDRSVSKYYLALVCGDVGQPAAIHGYLHKDSRTNKVVVSAVELEDSDEIHTEYEPLAHQGAVTLLKVKLITGKTHQIRAHLAAIGHPVLGDPKYGDREINRKLNARRQLLHSYEVVFPEMEGDFANISGRTFHTDIPKEFGRYIKELL